MHVLGRIFVITAGLLAIPASNAATTVDRLAVGTVTLIITETETKATSDGSTSSSRDRDAMIERVLGRTDAGLQLEYDLPAEVTAGERAATWQFPMRVLVSSHAPPALLNRSELKARVDRWLKSADLPRGACGQWIFTWNAFRIECDPDTALQMIEPIDLGLSALRGGVRTTGSGGVSVRFSQAVDAEQARRERADDDVAVAQMTGKALTVPAARAAHAAERIEGTIATTFELDGNGDPVRRRRITTVHVTTGAKVETQVQTQTVERRPVPAGDSQRRRSTI